MGSRICMNSTCRTKITVQWKKGWDLKSGETADLCFKCGSAYENFVYCDTFHSEETGWRECSLCNKPLHCGCSAAVAFIEIQDLGGVWCISCAQSADRVSIRRDGISSRAQTIRIYSGASNLRNVQVHNKLDADKISNGNLLSLGNIVEAKEPKYFPRPHTEHTDGSFGQVTWEVKHPGDVVDLGFPSLSQPPNEVSTFVTSNDDKRNTGTESMHEPSVHTSLNISLCSPSETSSFGLTLPNGVEEQEKSMPCLVQSGQRPRHILPKPPKSVVARGSDANKNSFTQIRVARPPAEGRLRNQLLPRYWPRITDQELQKLSGDLNSTIVPLFEKVLSASDASRIGRLVLPKACAEAYFPPINQSEGLPLKVQDVKGNEWTFQFRFWPNNNSRMYVLEGVTPCIQSMQLQAGDTVTFSRRDPGGKLVMGFRKASNSAEAQDFRTSAPNGVASGESSYADMTENLPAVNGYPGLQSLKCSKDSHLRPNFDKPNLVNGDALWVKSEKFKGKVDEDLLQQPAPSSDKKRTRNISSKNKRLLMHSEDAMELKLTWEETQDLLRPPPNVQPNIVMIEDFEFEEYNEPPVFGKKTFFVTPLPGGHEQWAQCDKCSKWRKLPVDVLLPPKWTCADNAWDSSRSSCSSPEEMSSNELDNLVRTTKDVKKRRIAETPAGEGCEPSGLDALATAATLGDHEESSSGATTRHPRHRPGCTCIVCIQPPSGKGKHKPSCDCNVCLTVRRRFRTLMMRKQKREAEMSQQKNHNHPTEESQLNNGTHDDATLHKDQMVCEFNEGKVLCEEGESSNKGHIDLNCHPVREEDMLVEAQLGGCMMNLVEATCLPLDVYVKHNGGIGSLGCEKQSETESCMQQQGEGQKEQGSVAEQESCATVVVVGEQERRRDQASPKDTTSD